MVGPNKSECLSLSFFLVSLLIHLRVRPCKGLCAQNGTDRLALLTVVKDRFCNIDTSGQFYKSFCFSSNGRAK